MSDEWWLWWGSQGLKLLLEQNSLHPMGENTSPIYCLCTFWRFAHFCAKSHLSNLYGKSILLCQEAGFIINVGCVEIHHWMMLDCHCLHLSFGINVLVGACQLVPLWCFNISNNHDSTFSWSWFHCWVLLCSLMLLPVVVYWSNHAASFCSISSFLMMELYMY